jgi:hypothetical protein
MIQVPDSNPLSAILPSAELLRENSLFAEPRLAGNPAPEGRPSLAQRFSMCVRTRFRATKWNGLAGNPAPEGLSFQLGGEGIVIL